MITYPAGTTTSSGTQGAWVTPPTDGSERIDGAGVTLLVADRVITGRRGRAAGSLEVVGEVDGTDRQRRAARAAGAGGAVLLDRGQVAAVGTVGELEAALAGRGLPEADVDP